ncbi:GHMP family kinase ATP-binding protein [Alicyclobacillus sendaiensis]|uniref:GHMP family kinase ATP-binding protein n=1 Tax=Alicyclobacillus sendaiensis TaxID=192387 RepID=UPI0026F420E4|nr:hypothetical protein [Alicyclobacillus sendaiensis]
MSNLLIDTRVGIGFANGHHGEILQGIFCGVDGRLHRGLITLPNHTVGTLARFVSNGSSKITVSPEDRIKAKRAAEITSKVLSGRIIGGTLTLFSKGAIGRGLGSSTSDVVATIWAIANSLQVTMSAYQVAEIAVLAEEASDSIMFRDNTVLFAHREGIVLHHFNGPLPPLQVLGFDTLRESIDMIDTLKLELPNYSPEEVEAFRVLHGLLEHAIQTQDASLVGCVSTASSIINQKYLPKPYFDDIMSISQDVKALGVQVAHSGSVVGILFSPSDKFLKDKLKNARKLIQEIGFDPYEIQCF